MFPQQGDASLDDRLDATNPVATVRVAPGDGVTHPEHRPIVRRHMLVAKLCRGMGSKRSGDQLPIGAFQRSIAFDHAMGDSIAESLSVSAARHKGRASRSATPRTCRLREIGFRRSALVRGTVVGPVLAGAVFAVIYAVAFTAIGVVARVMGSPMSLPSVLRSLALTQSMCPPVSVRGEGRRWRG